MDVPPADVVTYARDHDGVVELTLRREKVHNALDQATLDALGVSLDRYESDNEASVAILSGAGASFCSGADVKAFRAGGGRLRGLPELFLVRDRYKPIIVAAHGHVIGAGLRLRLLADLAICAGDARLCVRELSNGLDAGPYHALLADRAGDAFAMDVTATGRSWSGEEAARRGIVVRSVPGERLRDEARGLAHELRRQPADALSALIEARRSGLRTLELSAWLTRGRTLSWGPRPARTGVGSGHE